MLYCTFVASGILTVARLGTQLREKQHGGLPRLPQATLSCLLETKFILKEKS